MSTSNFEYEQCVHDIIRSMNAFKISKVRMYDSNPFIVSNTYCLSWHVCYILSHHSFGFANIRQKSFKFIKQAKDQMIPIELTNCRKHFGVLSCVKYYENFWIYFFTSRKCLGHQALNNSVLSLFFCQLYPFSPIVH